MILEETFIDEFNKLCAAFSTSKSKEICSQWGVEFEDCDLTTFRKAMLRCQYGDRFPNWDMFRTQYRNCLPETERAQTIPAEILACTHNYKTLEKQGNENLAPCFDGAILVQGFRAKTGKLGNFRFNCAICSKNRDPGLISGNPKELAWCFVNQVWATENGANEAARQEKIRKAAMDEESKEAVAAYDRAFPKSWAEKMQKVCEGATASERQKIADNFIKAQFGTPDPENEAKREKSIHKAKQRNAGVF
jgi:hypothetical protein